MGDLRPGEPHEKGERRVDREPDDYGELPARGHDVVLRRPRPADKGHGDSPAGMSPAKEFGESCSSEPVDGDRGEEGEHRQALAEVDVRGLLGQTNVPASRRRSPLEPCPELASRATVD